MQTLDSDSDSLSCMIFQYTIGGISKQLLTTKVIFKSLWFCVYIETGYDSGTYQCWTPHNTDWTDKQFSLTLGISDSGNHYPNKLHSS